MFAKCSLYPLTIVTGIVETSVLPHICDALEVAYSRLCLVANELFSTRELKMLPGKDRKM